MNIINTQTETNLLIAFAGESQARNRYSYFSGQAKKEGLEQMAAIFEETANQEKEHAKRFFSFLKGRDLEITATYPAGKIGTTIENLEAAAAGENYEWSVLYPSFAERAREEGFEQIAKMFEAVCIAEKRHESRYLDLLQKLKDGEVFIRENVVIWLCRNCGYIEESKTAPKICPSCAHPQSYFEVTGNREIII
jgi:rubrerythrin